MVPPEARWTHLQAHTGQPTISKLVDDAMAAIERDNPQLKDALYRNYDPASLSKCRLGELIDLISTIPHTDESGDSANLLARVFEHSVIHFSHADSGSSGEYYTPSSVMGVFAEYDPCCGSGGMFAQSQLYLDQVKSSGSCWSDATNPSGGGVASN